MTQAALLTGYVNFSGNLRDNIAPERLGIVLFQSDDVRVKELSQCLTYVLCMQGWVLRDRRWQMQHI